MRFVFLTIKLLSACLKNAAFLLKKGESAGAENITGKRFTAMRQKNFSPEKTDRFC